MDFDSGVLGLEPGDEARGNLERLGGQNYAAGKLSLDDAAALG